jgi:hypothetical protein
VAGLYFVGPIAANRFGPMRRFVFGANYAAPGFRGISLRDSTNTTNPAPEMPIALPTRTSASSCLSGTIQDCDDEGHINRTAVALR